MKTVKIVVKDKDDMFSVYVMKRVAVILEKHKYRISTFEIFGYAHLKVTLKLNFYDCNMYWEWCQKGCDSNDIELKMWLGEDKQCNHAEFADRYNECELDDI